MAQQQTASESVPQKGILELMTTRIEVVPVITIFLFALLYFAGFTKIIPADLVNKILQYVGMY